MKNLILGILMLTGLAGCVTYPVEYQPGVVVGEYPIGYYNPAFGYWTGFGWDVNFYAYGHPGYGHHYYHGGYYRHH